MVAWATAGRYDPVNDVWTALPLTGSPPSARGQCEAQVWTGRAMLIWGGSGAGGPLNTGGVYDP